MCTIAPVLCATLCLAAAVQERPDADELSRQLEQVNALGREIQARVRAAREGGNVLAEVEALRALEREYASKGPMAQQVLALQLMERTVVLGNYGEALRYADLSQGATGWAPVADDALDGYEPQEALEALAELASGERAVLINEAHHVPQHRALTLQLLHRLRSLGFTHFAAETLFETDTSLEQRGYPTSATGAYTEEPVYGDLVRTALALGYRVVPYESLGGPDRELGQAQNLAQRVFEHDPEARVIVHAGYAHINEQGEIAGRRAMAQRLAELTGLDPLTIDQTVMSERATAAREHPLYRRVCADGAVETATVFRGERGRPWSLEPGVRDVTLFHPRTVLEDGRPTWLRLGGLRRVYALPEDVCAETPRCLVRARALDESADAVPLDQIEVVAAKPPPALLLPPGEFWLEVRGPAEEDLATLRIVVR